MHRKANSLGLIFLCKSQGETDDSLKKEKKIPKKMGYVYLGL